MKVSALTVKKAYDRLEEEGFIVTVHGKGSFVACANQETMLEKNELIEYRKSFGESFITCDSPKLSLLYLYFILERGYPFKGHILKIV